MARLRAESHKTTAALVLGIVGTVVGIFLFLYWLVTTL